MRSYGKSGFVFCIASCLLSAHTERIWATPPAIPGDYNGDGIVAAADYTVWRDTLGLSTAPFLSADGDGNGLVGPEDYYFWKARFEQGAISSSPSPGTSLDVTSSYNQTTGVIEWQVKVVQDTDDGSSLAVELPFELSAISGGFTASLNDGGDATNGAVDGTWYFNETSAGSSTLIWNTQRDGSYEEQNPGNNPFTGTVTEGLQVDTGGLTVFASLGSDVFLTEPVKTLHIASSDGELSWSDALLAENEIAHTVSGLASSVVVGIEGESYRVKSFKEMLHQEQPAIPYNETEPPGGIYGLGFPAEAEYGELHRDLEAILEALRQWGRPSYGPYRFGADAYDVWIEVLQAQRADRFGCGYNAACYAEGRRFAQQFFERMSTRRPLAANLLRQAAESYRHAADAIEGVSEVFPFGHDEKGRITAAARIDQAAGLLEEARDAEDQAMAFLSDITKIQVRRPTPESP